jgi:ribosomal protein S7
MIKKEKNFKNIFYTKFLGILIKKGKKAKAKKILDTVLSKVSKKTKLTTNFVLYRVFF